MRARFNFTNGWVGLFVLAATGASIGVWAVADAEAMSRSAAAINIVESWEFDCTYHCSTSTCPPEEHESYPIDPTFQGNSDLDHTEECTAIGECADHFCEQHQEEDADLIEDLARLEALVAGMNGETLFRLTRARPEIRLNVERAAIQVVGCDEEDVLTNVPLHPSQLKELLPAKE